MGEGAGWERGGNEGEGGPWREGVKRGRMCRLEIANATWLYEYKSNVSRTMNCAWFGEEEGSEEGVNGSRLEEGGRERSHPPFLSSGFQKESPPRSPFKLKPVPIIS
jgi:hypothetical protein